MLFFLIDIFSVLDGGYDTCIGRRSAYALFFHGFYQGSFRIPGRRLGEMLLLLKVRTSSLVPCLQVRQSRAHGLGLFVPAFFVDCQEAGKPDALVGSTENMAFAGSIDRYSVIDSICHLACQETAPDQLIQPILLPGERPLDPVRIQLHMGGTDGFVGILGAGLGLKHMVLAVIIGGAVAALDERTGCIHSFVAKTQGVGTHIGDKTQSAFSGHIHAFIKLLGNGHGALRGHIQLPGCFLLECRSGERRGGGALLLCPLYAVHREGFAFHFPDNGIHLVFTFQLCLLALSKVPSNELAILAKQGKGGIQRPVFLALERPDLIFPVHNQLGGHRLDTARTQATANLLPQQRRKLIAYDPVQHTAGLLGIHQIFINVPGTFNGLADHLLGNFVKGDTASLLRRQAQKFF